MVYTVTCNPAIDYVAMLSAPLQEGSINRNRDEAFQYGGKGINVSRVLRECGYESVLLGFVAGFTGEGLEKGLQAQGFDTRFLHVEEGMTRINVKIKAGDETEINGLGPVIKKTHWESLLAQIEECQEGDVLVLSGSLPRGLSVDSYQTIAAQVEDRGVKLVVDAVGELLLRTLPHHPFLIKPNQHELADMIGSPCETLTQIEVGAKWLQMQGARNVLISMAGDGAFLLDEMGNSYMCPCPMGAVKNSVGAGDSMVAGFLAGYLTTENYPEALRLGVAAGSATAFSIDLAIKKQIDALYEGMGNIL